MKRFLEPSLRRAFRAVQNLCQPGLSSEFESAVVHVYILYCASYGKYACTLYGNMAIFSDGRYLSVFLSKYYEISLQVTL